MTEIRYGFVRGLSMWPALLPGELLKAKEVSGHALERDQIVVVEGLNGPVVHRVVRVVRPRGLAQVLLMAGDGSGPDRPCKLPAEVLLVTDVLRKGRWRRPGKLFPCRPVPGWLMRCTARLLGRVFR